MAAVIPSDGTRTSPAGHAGWVRVSHWLIAAGVLTLAFSGFVILMAHPRLYWGKAGNDLTPALIELPFGRNYKHGGWEPATLFAAGVKPIVSQVRTYDIFNENGWARSLHFLAVWVLLLAGLTYLTGGVWSGHLWNHIIPGIRDLSPRRVWSDIREHLGRQAVQVRAGPPYGLLQKLSYAAVVLIVLPLMVWTGLTMSPAVTAAYPGLLDTFGGSQSARTLHFVGFSLLLLFVIVHVVMVVRTGFKRQLRAMTIGE